MRKIKKSYIIGTILVFIVAGISLVLLSGLSSELQERLAGIDVSSMTSEDYAQAKAVATGKTLGIISLVPAILTVILAFVTKEVIFSLFAGMLSGLIILVGTNGMIGGVVGSISTVFNTAGETIVKMTTDSFQSSIIILCLCIGGMVAVINASGGFAAMGNKLTKNINSPKRAVLMAQAMGMCLFFDDYANSLITGPVMRDITDRQGVSREKLAYIVDSTAAPVAGIAIISSWIAAELSAIESGFAIAGIEGSAYSHFFASIPYCTYNFVAIGFVLFTALMGREYGPMLHAERRARSGMPLKNPTPSTEEENSTGAVLEGGSIWSAIIPIATMIVYSLVGFYTDGMATAVEAGLISAGTGFSFASLTTAFGNASTVDILMRASILASIIAIFMGCVTGRFNIAGGIGAWMKGLSGIMLTAVILVLAWALSYVIGELGAAYYLVDIVTLSLPYWLLPMLIFIACCGISFAAGSFGCMVIVMPIAVPVAYSSALAAGIAYDQQFVFACIAAVLSGSIFGDHCSPVTDTTILSSLGAGCDNLDHVRTQLPYALSVATIASLVGYLPAGLGVSPWISLPLALVAGVLMVRFVGKKVESTSEASEHR